MMDKNNAYDSMRKVFEAFLKEVVSRKVFSEYERDYEGKLLHEKQKTEIASGKKKDIRPPYLCRTSAKGGKGATPEENEKFSKFFNVSLLDHLMSVVRGAITFAAFDLAEKYPEISGTDLEKRLACIAVIAFSHDIDKVLKMSRSETIAEKDVKAFMERYGLDDFLSKFNLSLTAGELRYYINQCEFNRQGGEVSQNIDRDILNDCNYVQIADQMDSAFLDSDSGVEVSVEILKNNQQFRTSVWNRDWEIITLNEPNFPRLMERLLIMLSNECFDRHNMKPLLEVYFDGCLTCVVPKDGADELLDEALRKTASKFGGEMRINVSAKGTIEILDRSGDMDDLEAAIENMSETDRNKLPQIRKEFYDKHKDDIDAWLLSKQGRVPEWPKKIQGKSASMMSGEKDDADYSEFRILLNIITVLFCGKEHKSLKKTLSGSVREKELLELLIKFGIFDEEGVLPDWLSEAKDSDRWAVLAFLAAGVADEDDKFKECLLDDEEGLGHKWLEGLVSTIEKSELGDAVVSYFKTVLSNETVIAENEDADGRCHFINIPVEKREIGLKDGLFAVKVSAFSGRTGRPEFVHSPKSGTYVSPIAQAEYKLRQMDFEKNKKGKGDTLSAFITSPTSSGLFGSLAFGNDIYEVAVYEMMRMDMTRTVFDDIEGIKKRTFIGRFESFPDKILSSKEGSFGQISFVRGILQSSLRLGRPIHVFKGLPRSRREFVYFDSLPQFLEILMGGNSLRIEDIEEVIFYLDGIEKIAETSGFGLELAMSVVHPETRYMALCDAWSRAGKTDNKTIEFFTKKALQKEGESVKMSKINEFAETVALFQKAPRVNDGKTKSELAFRIALEICENENFTEIDLKNAIAGSIKESMERGNMLYGSNRFDNISKAAEIFVDDIWKGVFDEKMPPSKEKRHYIASFHWAFMKASKARFTETDETVKVD